MPIAPGQIVAGLRSAYRIEAWHGQGSFGVTYRATDAGNGASVIVKELRVERLADWKALELFEREGEVLASLSHPNIPAFCDFFARAAGAALPVAAMESYAGPEAPSLVLVQQFIEGSTLQACVERCAPLSAGDAEGVLRALLGALRYLHERTPPLVHRDIKPGNVILAPSGQPYLVDFGAIQNRLRSPDSVGSTVVGTLGYMPLEQIRGDARPASDLYALGVTMTVALAARPVEQLSFDDATGKIDLARALPAGVSPRMRAALDAMIAPLLGQRAHSAAEVLAKLDAPPPAPPRTFAPAPAPAFAPALAHAYAPSRSFGPDPSSLPGPGPGPDPDPDAEVRALQKSLGVGRFFRRRPRPGSPVPGLHPGAFLVPLGVFAIVIAVFVLTRPDLVAGAKAEFSKRYTCPLSRVELRERPDIDVATFEAPPARTPPKDIAADPGRLAVWKANQPKPRDNGDTIFEMTGCGHHLLWGCRRGQKLMSCGYEHELAPVPSSSGSQPGSASNGLPAAPAVDVEPGPVTVTWGGHLDTSTGDAPPVGTPCTLSATVQSKGTQADEKRVTFACKGQTLYDSDDPLSGISDSMFSFGENLDDEDAHGLVYRYDLGAKDIGTRSPPRSQIMMFTPRGVLDAWRDTTSPFRVHATIDQLSSLRQGKPVLSNTTTPFEGVVERRARVTSKTGTVPFATSTCTLRIAPAHSGANNCRVHLECGGHPLYGAGRSGFDQCTLAGGRPRSFVDANPTPKDTDPAFQCDLDAGTATLSDATAAGVTTYTVTFALSE
ncbi:MAG TPA: serine/threonine-protein kinase [Polyangiaceae bacterium]|jgi:serine/threonine protein kinase